MRLHLDESEAVGLELRENLRDLIREERRFALAGDAGGVETALLCHLASHLEDALVDGLGLAAVNTAGGGHRCDAPFAAAGTGLRTGDYAERIEFHRVGFPIF